MAHQGDFRLHPVSAWDTQSHAVSQSTPQPEGCEESPSASLAEPRVTKKRQRCCCHAHIYLQPLAPWAGQLPRAEHGGREGRKIQHSALPLHNSMRCVQGWEKGQSNLLLPPQEAASSPKHPFLGAENVCLTKKKEKRKNDSCSYGLFQCENVFFISS